MSAFSLRECLFQQEENLANALQQRLIIIDENGLLQQITIDENRLLGYD